MNDDQFTKLLNYMDKRFDEMDKRFDGVDKRFDGIDKRLDGVDKRLDDVERELKDKVSQDQFTKLFKYVQDFTKSFEKRLDDKASQASIDRLSAAVDSLVYPSRGSRFLA